MNNIREVLSIGVIFLLMSCGDGNVIIEEDPAIQATEDSATIVNYLSDLGFEGDEVVILESGVRYVILDQGSGDIIDESDIVSFDYIGMLTNDTIFDTSIQEVADSIVNVVSEDTVGRADDDINEQLRILNSFPDTRTYEPFTVTYSASGWTLEGLFIDGFSEGIAATFDEVLTGGHVLIVLPSSEAYGPIGSGFLIGPDEVIAFELFPREVTKQ